jgi:hypothetical protein
MTSKTQLVWIRAEPTPALAALLAFGIRRAAIFILFLCSLSYLIQNWFPNIIGTPEVVSITCLLLDDTLEPSEFSNCTHITGRAYNTFIVPAKQVGVLTGASASKSKKKGY